jgi:hypothetical protein
MVPSSIWKKQYVGSKCPYADGELEMKLLLVEKFLRSDDLGNPVGFTMRFRDGDGHCIVWFTERKNICLEVGAVILARFTVASHHCYRHVWENHTKGFTVVEVSTNLTEGDRT